MADEPKTVPEASAPEATEPQPQYQPQEPVAPTTPYEQQPVAQQYFAQPQSAPVQYVVQAKSLKGKGGWLAFFMVLAALASLGYVGQFITSLEKSDPAAMIFAPILFIFALTSVILIALEKKIAKWVYISFWSVSLIYGITTGVISGAKMTDLLSATIIQLVILVFVALYFLVSKRVKETLVK